MSEFGFFSMKLFNTSDKIHFGKHQWRSAFLWHPSSTKAWMTISGHKGAEDLMRRIRLIEQVIVWNTIWKFLFWKLSNIHNIERKTLSASMYPSLAPVIINIWPTWSHSSLSSPWYLLDYLKTNPTHHLCVAFTLSNVDRAKGVQGRWRM